MPGFHSLTWTGALWHFWYGIRNPWFLKKKGDLAICAGDTVVSQSSIPINGTKNISTGPNVISKKGWRKGRGMGLGAGLGNSLSCKEQLVLSFQTEWESQVISSGARKENSWPRRSEDRETKASKAAEVSLYTAPFTTGLSTGKRNRNTNLTAGSPAQVQRVYGKERCPYPGRPGSGTSLASYP